MDWKEIYPVLAEYPNVVDMERLNAALTELFDSLQNKYGMTKTEAFLVIKDAAYRLYLQRKDA